jgi:protein-S-isoprenylcysteine O-methyltransferase Ste14
MNCSASRVQRVTLAGLAAVWVAIIWWMLFAGGLETAGGLLGLAWTPGDLLRRVCMATALSVYYVRLLFTWFLFLRRGIRWQEVSAVALWLLCIYLVMAIEGGRNIAPFGANGVIGLVLFCGGSWLNSYAEYVRHVWKRYPERQGLLYTRGPFRYSRHPNYLGDLVAYSGLCFMSGILTTALIPLITAAGFVFVNIPALDAHLHHSYGKAFDDYAKRTSKLIPFVY